jgi:mannose-binding lectin 1
MIRGFLNDGSTDYSKSHNIDQLAFGHCFYSYRNLGRPSQIKFRQEAENFRVEIDGRLCFESGKIRIPAGYKFGLTAATPDNPDSWEIFKLVVMSDSLDPSSAGTASTSSNQQEAQKVMPAEDKPKSEKNTKKKKTEDSQTSAQSEGSFFVGDESSGQEQPAFDDPYDNSIVDHEAEYYTSSRSQFADLHDRLQSVNHHVSTIYRTVSKHSLIGERRHEEVSKMLHQIQQELDALREIKTKINELDREVKDMRKDMNNKLKTSESSLKTFLSDHHATISDSIVKAAPGHGRLIFVIVGSQLILVAGYALYKRRKGASPKKYL